MKIEVYYKNGKFDYACLRYCCDSLKWVHQIKMVENPKRMIDPFYMALVETDIIKYDDDKHVKIERTNYPIKYCPFCGEKIEIESFEQIETEQEEN